MEAKKMEETKMSDLSGVVEKLAEKVFTDNDILVEDKSTSVTHRLVEMGVLAGLRYAYDDVVETRKKEEK